MKIINEKQIASDEGMILTNGRIYATELRLGEWDSVENYHEITAEEYTELQSGQI